MLYPWMISRTPKKEVSVWKVVDGKKVYDPFNKIDETKNIEEEDRSYEKQTQDNQLKYFNLQKADYERGISRENKAQANLDSASSFVFGKRG